MSETSMMINKIYALVKGIDISEVTSDRVLQDLQELCESEKIILPSESSDDCGTFASISVRARPRLELIRTDEIKTPEEIEAYLEDFFSLKYLRENTFEDWFS